MIPLPLNPLPSTRVDELSDALLIEREGFVDEAVVMAMVNAPLHIPAAEPPQDLAMTVDEMDYAGWRPPVADAPVPSPGAVVGIIPPQSPAPPPQPQPAAIPHKDPVPTGTTEIRRATPPEMDGGNDTPELEKETSGWWLAWVAGILTVSALCLLLYYLANGSRSLWPAAPVPTAPPPVAR